MKERLNEPANLSVRMGPAYDFRPSNFWQICERTLGQPLRIS